MNSAVNGFTYDAAGNVTSDNVNLYLYDGEGRICAVKSTPVAGFTTMTGYVYDAEGNRVAKGAIATWSCDPSVNGLVTAANVTDYILGSGGEQVTEMAQNASGNMEARHVNVWAGGKLLATYDPNGLHFYLDDPLGSRRVQTDYAGVVEQNCASLPFGDGESCAPLPTEHLFTGKERDSESGNDYFGARYYASSMGRFMSPDPLMFNELRLVNPQRWNMYTYAVNNPIIFNDPTGLDAASVTFTTKIPVVGHTGIMSVHPDGSVTFAQFGPQGNAKPYGTGEVTSWSSGTGDLPTLSFDLNGYPTSASLSALESKLGSLEGVSPGSIKIAYFKTNSSETAALDQYISQWLAASKTGKLTYLFTGPNCATFSQAGMKAAGQPDFHGQLPIPNLLGFNWWWASGQGTQDKPKEVVTHKICDENGNNCH